MRTPTLIAALVVLLGAGSGCERVKGWVGNDDVGELTDGSDPPPIDEYPEIAPAEPPDVERPKVREEQPLPLNEGDLRRGPRRLWFPARGGTNLGFKLGPLSQQYALEATVEVPSFGAKGTGGLELTRDDDIDTAWTCTGGDEPCAIGLRTPEPSTLESVRMFVGAGPERDDWERSPRIKLLRLHTDQGYADVPLPDERTHLYIALGQPVLTRTVVLEVIETWGDASGPLHFAELELYGTDGPKREPWKIDPAASFVSSAASPYRQFSNQHELGDVFIHLMDEDGKARKFMAGSALIGKAGDRLLLVERISGAECPHARGTYFLLDQQTRMLAPLGELTGMAGSAFRLENGRGFGVGYSDEFTTTLGGVVIEGGEYLRKRTPFREDKRTQDSFAAWGLDRTEIPRGGQAPTTTEGCEPAAESDLAALTQALASLGKRGRPRALAPASSWHRCDLDGSSFAMVSPTGGCGDAIAIHIVDATSGTGKLLGSFEEKRKNATVWARRAGDGLLLEPSSPTADGPVLRLTGSGIANMGPHTTLAIRPPQACRKTCDTQFGNPNAP